MTYQKLLQQAQERALELDKKKVQLSYYYSMLQV